MNNNYHLNNPATFGYLQNTAMPATLTTPEPTETQHPPKANMNSTTGLYQGVISDAADYERVKREYLSQNDMARKQVTDLPHSAEQRRALIKAMFEAALDCSETYEPPDSQSVEKIRSGSYTDVEWELVLWPLLMSACSAQEGRCQIPRYLGCKAPPYNPYESFTERFRAIVDALRTSKALVLSLFKDATFIDRVAWRPKTELSVKAANRKLNNDRDARNAIALRVADRDGIKADEDGRLVDTNGEVYGSVKKRSAALEGTVTKSKKRSRTTKRDPSVSSVTTTSHQASKDTMGNTINNPSPGGPLSLIQNNNPPAASFATTMPNASFSPPSMHQQPAPFYFQQGSELTLAAFEDN
ncbi:hypothetical protein F4776DRAFT_670479 [Hypoxylon sp. NC0597]|nr:hypothetical protein F4776DRAFT_670479 [Hypoxylon sp. NC0597]